MNTDSLEARIYSAFPIIKIETDEEPRLLISIRKIAERIGKSVIGWSIASGTDVLQSDRNGSALNGQWAIDGYGGHPATGYRETDEDEKNSYNPEHILEQLKEDVSNSIIILLDFHPFLEKLMK